MVLVRNLRTVPQSDCLRKGEIKKEFKVCNSLTRKENGHTYPCEQCKTQDWLRVFMPTEQNASDDPTDGVGEELAPDQHYRTSEEGRPPAATVRDPKSLKPSRCRVYWVHSRSGGLEFRSVA